MKPLGIIALAWGLCGACSSNEEVDCTLFGERAVTVEVVGDEEVVAVTETHQGESKLCPNGFASSGDSGASTKLEFLCYEIGDPPGGSYVINVHGSEHRWTTSVELRGDKCHVTEPKTVTVDLTAEPTGAAELAVCADDSDFCCVDTPPRGSCHAEGLECRSSCKLASPAAAAGTRDSWTCRDGAWVAGSTGNTCSPDAKKGED